MELIGKVERILEPQTGVSARGEWKKQDVIIETMEQFPKKVCITCWGERVDDLNRLSPGMSAKFFINIESREFKERWYTDVKAWKIEAQQEAASGGQEQNIPADQGGTEADFNLGNDDDDLPF